MNCDLARQRWHNRLETGSEDAELDLHLNSCESCSNYARQMQQTADLLDLLRIETESIEAQEQTIAHPSLTRSPALRWPTRITGIAAVLLIAITATVYFRTHRNPSAPIAPKIDNTAPQSTSKVYLELKGNSADCLVPMHVAGIQDEPVNVVWLYPSCPNMQDTE